MNFARWKLAIPLLLGAFVLGLRALLIGQPPFTDEGVYASMSYLVWHHPFEPLPSLCPISSINVYPWALSWLCALPSGSLQLVAFRAADALLAACCAISIYFLLVELSKNRWIAAGLGLLWTLCTNHPALINAGFKNAYAPGLLCVIWALWLLVRHREDPPLLCIGTLLGMTFLIREPLVVFALPIFVYVVWHLSWRQAVRLTAGAGFTAILGLAGLGLVRGGDIAANLRGIVGGGMALVTPGIRPAGSAAGDQKRIMTPARAIAAGADYLVVGRPIVEAADPKAAAQAIVDEIAQARDDVKAQQQQQQQ